MSENRLPTELWVRAHVRTCSVRGIPAYILRRGNAESGMVLLKLNRLAEGCRVLTQSRDLEGRMGWLPALSGRWVPEAEADAYIARATARDPDLWVVEVEDRQGRHPFDGPEI